MLLGTETAPARYTPVESAATELPSSSALDLNRGRAGQAAREWTSEQGLRRDARVCVLCTTTDDVGEGVVRVSQASFQLILRNLIRNSNLRVSIVSSDFSIRDVLTYYFLFNNASCRICEHEMRPKWHFRNSTSKIMTRIQTLPSFRLNSPKR